MSAYDEPRPALLGLAYRLLGSRADAEDVVQEAWLRWSRAGELDNPGAGDGGGGGEPAVALHGGLGLVSQGFSSEACAVPQA